MGLTDKPTTPASKPLLLKARPVFTTLNGPAPTQQRLGRDNTYLGKPMAPSGTQAAPKAATQPAPVPPALKPKPKPKPKAKAKPPAPEAKPKVVAMRKPPPEPEPMPDPATSPLAAQIERMAGVGMDRRAICDVLGLHLSQLAAYEEQLRIGVAKANYKVSNALFTVATDMAHPKFASCNIFWAKARMGWRDQGDDNPLNPLDAEPKGPTDDEITSRFDQLMGRFKTGEKNAG